MLTFVHAGDAVTYRDTTIPELAGAIGMFVRSNARGEVVTVDFDGHPGVMLPAATVAKVTRVTCDIRGTGSIRRVYQHRGQLALHVTYDRGSLVDVFAASVRPAS